MKKQGLTVTLSIVLVLTLAFCKKTKISDHPTEASETTSSISNGLPGDLNTVNGYLYASFETVTTNTMGNIVSYAAFADPARNLLPTYDHFNDQPIAATFTGSNNTTHGNINVGSVSFNGTSIFPNASSYTWSYAGNAFNSTALKNVNAKWVTSGNKTFKPLDLTVDRGFPVIKDTVLKASPVPTLSIANGYTLNVPASNYDSLTVYFEGGNKNIKKTLVAGQAFTMSKTELTSFATGAAQISFFAHNYSSQTIFGKIYVFEMARRSTGWLLNVRP